MKYGLTPKREKFAQGVAAGKSQADAYREAFTVREHTTDKSVHEAASTLMNDFKVASRVAELRPPIIAKAVEAAGMTLESHLADLKTLRNLAAKELQLSAAISAEVARGKASGVHVEQTRSTSTVAVVQVAMTPEEFKRLAREMAGRT